MTTLAFLDIDGTLAFPERDFGDLAVPYTCVDRTPIRQVAFSTDRTIGLLGALGDVGIDVVPTTARSAEQLDRMTLFRRRPVAAIVAAGAAIMIDGVPDEEWAHLLAERVARSAPTSEVVAGLDSAGHVARSITVREGRLIVLVYDRAESAEADATDLDVWAGSRGWSANADGRRVYLLPDELSKAAAAAHLAERSGAAGVMAAGDSALDVGLLAWADYAAAPAGSSAASGPLPRIHVTREHGPRAAEEICELLMLALLHDPNT